MNQTLSNVTQCLPLMAFTAFQAHKLYADIKNQQNDMAIFDGLDLVKLAYLDYKCLRQKEYELDEKIFEKFERKCLEQKFEEIGQMIVELQLGQFQSLELKKFNFDECHKL